MKVSSFIAVSIACIGTSVNAWGHDGHYLVGAVADRLISSASRNQLNAILGKSTSLAQVAAWADEIKGHTGYDRRLDSLHYVDTHDSPPNTCLYRPVLDCEGWCVTSAITNMTHWLSDAVKPTTSRRSSASSFSSEEGGISLLSDNEEGGISLLSGHGSDDGFSIVRRHRRPRRPSKPRKPDPTLPQPGAYTADALVKLIVHFIGDVHQPLHVEGEARGGTQFPLVWETHHASLHGIWDSNLLVKRMREFGDRNDYIKYLDDLYDTKYGNIAGAKWGCPAKKLVPVNGRLQPADSTSTVLCPAHWAAESNLLNCKTAWVGVKEHTTVSEDYYKRNYGIIEEQILKAGWRLAKVLNMALAGRDEESDE